MSPLAEEVQLEQPFSSEDYLGSVRDLYQKNKIDYRGRRSEDQAEIAELLSDEAASYINYRAAYFSGFLAPSASESPELLDHIEHTFDAEHRKKYEEMSASFLQAYVAIGIATYRASRDRVQDAQGKIIESLFELADTDRLAVLENVFNDFQQHNALRFGAEGSGVMRNVFHGEFDNDGEPITRTVDVDKVATSRLWSTVLATPYSDDFGGAGERTLVHPVAKLHPAEYKALRKNYPEIPKQQFDQIIHSNRNPQNRLEQ